MSDIMHARNSVRLCKAALSFEADIFASEVSGLVGRDAAVVGQV